MADRSGRYTTFVTTAKIVLPLVALGLLASLFLFSGVQRDIRELPYSESEIAEIITGQRLSAPQYRGTLESGDVIAVTADSAAPSPEDRQTILAETVSARVDRSDGEIIEMTAPRGGLDQTARTAFAEGGIVLTTSDGYELRAPRGTAAIDGLDVSAEGLVVVLGPGLRLEAGAMHLSGSGPGTEQVVFTGGIKLLYRPRDADRP